MSSEEAQQQQRPQRQRKPPFADWPTIKILTPPKGRFSPQTDEWCLTYCSQTVNGRIYGKEPFCRSLCIRKVFPHEVRNIVSFKTHKDLAADGVAKYPLPEEGQPANLPRYLGGLSTEKEDEDEKAAAKEEEPSYWHEGLYLWTSKSRASIHEKLDMMSLDLERQQKFQEKKERMQDLWQKHQDRLLQSPNNGDKPKLPDPSSVRGIIAVAVAKKPSYESLLVPLPPDTSSFWERIDKLLTPSYKVMGIFRDSISSGEQLEFAHRVWEKAWSNEPFILAGRTFNRAYEMWKDREVPPDEDDGKKGTPR